jgi:pyruvate formate lyase activating enzyme
MASGAAREAGILFDLQRFALHDGPGIRTTVFLKGCPLNCAWCHNPESRCREPQLSFDASLCTLSGDCVGVCPEDALSITRDRLVVDFERCTGCGLCVDVCPSGALTMVGEESSVEDVMAVVRRDRPYYDRSGGGMTLSGGEPAAQPEFALALLRAARNEGIHTCLDTSGWAGWTVFERFLPLVDLFLYDYKATPDDEHRRLTGVSNRLVLDNLERLLRAGARVALRCPLVPGVNDGPEHLRAIAGLCAMHPELEAVHVLPYHAMGRAKAERMGIGQPLGELPNACDGDVERWVGALAELGCTDVRVG